jgi:hypothetical protein
LIDFILENKIGEKLEELYLFLGDFLGKNYLYGK